MRPRFMIVVAAAAVLALATGGAAVANTATGWAIQATPKPSGAMGSGLNGISCTSASACMAVGSYDNRSGDQFALGEHWNGSKWKIRAPVRPSGATATSLDGVSCISARNCTAVGFYIGSSVFKAHQMAEHWNGSTWKIRATVRPSGASSSFLDAVSCFSAHNCTAVGFYKTSTAGDDFTLSEHWNGSKWKIRATPNRAGASGSILQGVSCASARRCTAVGTDNTATPLIEHWNGLRWKIQAAASPSSSIDSDLQGVSCTSARRCTAVGMYICGAGFGCSAGSGYQMAERWNGSTWTVQAAAWPVSYDLFGVSCVSAASCTAVGQGANNRPLAEYWNGSFWAAQAAATPSGCTDRLCPLQAVSCTSATRCTAVGEYENSADHLVALAERN